MGEGGEERELLHPVLAWTTAWRGGPRRDWWAALLIGRLVMMLATVGAFVGLTQLLGRVVETTPGGVLAIAPAAGATLCLAWAATFFVLIEGYCGASGLPWGEPMRAEAIAWAAGRGARSGRVARQFVIDLAGRRGVELARRPDDGPRARAARRGP